MYDYLIVGAGLFGSVFAKEATACGKKCLIIDKRDHIGGNCYTKKIHNINVHEYGPHIFHTNSDKIWDYVNNLVEFRQFIYSPIANYKDNFYSLPFNMWTFQQLWGVKTPAAALQKIEETRIVYKDPKNLEEYALSVLGKDVYEKLIYGYTKKHWMREPKDLPAFIIKRLPFRLKYDCNYYRDKYCGIPVDGYTAIFKKLLKDITVISSIDYFKDKEYWDSQAKKIVYTGQIDEYFGYSHGELEYRTLEFKHQILDTENIQGIPVINYTADDVVHTRTIEHKHFENSKSKKTILTTETPVQWSKEKIPYYPINDEVNNTRYQSYNKEAKKISSIIFGGRLASYKYYDMDQTIGSSLAALKKELG